jgi:Skp family chaperone for outer membrane proteins
LLLAALLAGPAPAQTRIATVDMGKLFYGYYKTKEAQAALDVHKTDVEKEHASMVEDYKKLGQDYQTALAAANNQALSADQRAQQRKLAEDKLKQLEKSGEALVEYERSAQVTFKDETERVQSKVIDEIRSALEAAAKSRGYTLVLDAAAVSSNGVPVILFHNDKDDDLTETVLAQLNATAPPAARQAPQKEPAKKKR